MGKLWLSFALVLIFLEVPVASSALVSTGIVLQSAVGTVVVRGLTGITERQLLLSAGPGLLIGGAVTFGLFQLGGRGLTGFLLVGCVGFLSLAILRVRYDHHATSTGSSPNMAKILCLAMFAMSSEFEWLLFLAFGLLIHLFIISTFRSYGQIVRLIGISIVVISLFVSTLFRAENWWLVSDDYLFFEVLSRHLTVSGPFSTWGSLDVSKYHWLAYGWSGLLDLIGNSPEELTTLTKVMPLVYSVVLGSSVLLVLEKLAESATSTFISVFPPIVIVAGSRIDWSGTSTAGIFSVLAALLATVAPQGNESLSTSRRLIAYLIFTPIVVFTKFSSIFAFLVLLICVEISAQARSSVKPFGARNLAFTALIAGCLSLVLLLPVSALVGGFSVSLGLQNGFLSRESALTRFVLSILEHCWLFLFPALAAIIVRRRQTPTRSSRCNSLLLSLSSFSLIGAAMAAIVPDSEYANLHTYFSDPFYFLASMALIVMAQALLEETDDRAHFRQSCFAILTGTNAFILFKVATNIQVVEFIRPLSIHSLVTDSRFVFGGILVGLWSSTAKKIPGLAKVTVLILLSIASLEATWPSLERLSARTSTSEINPIETTELLGPADSKIVGKWLRTHTIESDLIATNYLYKNRDESSYSDDYSLAVWSHREFLVLGPKFFGASKDLSREVELSIRFGNNPSTEDSDVLSDLGVRWFVIDTTTTSNRSWEPFAKIAFRGTRFWVLKLSNMP